jgi:hypothetical protein
MKKVTLLSKKFILVCENYIDNDTPAITLYYRGEPWLDLTTNIEGASSILKQGECLVKTWSENEPYIQPLLESGLFEDTGRRVPCGFAQAHIWRIVVDMH